MGGDCVGKSGREEGEFRGGGEFREARVYSDDVDASLDTGDIRVSTPFRCL